MEHEEGRAIVQRYTRAFDRWRYEAGKGPGADVEELHRAHAELKDALEAWRAWVIPDGD